MRAFSLVVLYVLLGSAGCGEADRQAVDSGGTWDIIEPDVPEPPACLCVHGACAPGVGWCSSCAPDAFGERCEQLCSCVHGSCHAGVEGTGLCYCEDFWSGDACDRCGEGLLICAGRCLQPAGVHRLSHEGAEREVLSSSGAVVQRVVLPEAGLVTAVRVHLRPTNGQVFVVAEAPEGAQATSTVVHPTLAGWYSFVFREPLQLAAGEELRVRLLPEDTLELSLTTASPALTMELRDADDVPIEDAALRFEVQLSGCPAEPAQ